MLAYEIWFQQLVFSLKVELKNQDPPDQITLLQARLHKKIMLAGTLTCQQETIHSLNLPSLSLGTIQFLTSLPLLVRVTKLLR